MHRIVVNLHRRISVGSRKSNDMVTSVIHFGMDITNSDIFGPQIVIQKQFSAILEWTQFFLVLVLNVCNILTISS